MKQLKRNSNQTLTQLCASVPVMIALRCKQYFHLKILSPFGHGHNKHLLRDVSLSFTLASWVSMKTKGGIKVAVFSTVQLLIDEHVFFAKE